jgi:hypothetical protein
MVSRLTNDFWMPITNWLSYTSIDFYRIKRLLYWFKEAQPTIEQGASNWLLVLPWINLFLQSVTVIVPLYIPIPQA